MEGDLKSMLTEKRSCEVKRLHGKVQDKLRDAIMKIRSRHQDVNSGINDRDLYAESLIPKHRMKAMDKFCTNNPVSLKVVEDGNCLYRSCSKLLSGKEELWSYLRELTSIELFLNKEYYAKHPFIMSKSIYFKSPNTAFSAALSDSALGDGYDRKVEEAKYDVVVREAIRTSVPGTFSPLICILALSSVIGKEIISVYPEEEGNETKYSWMNNGTIKPRIEHTQLENQYNQYTKAIIMWSKAGSSSFMPGIGSDFKPNHFVPLVGRDPSMPHTGYSRMSSQSKKQTSDTTQKHKIKLTDFFKIPESNKTQQASSPQLEKQTGSTETENITGTTKSVLKLKQCSTELHDQVEAKKSKNDAGDVDELDIGNYVNNVQGINDDMRFQLLENHWKPPRTHTFPTRQYGIKKIVSRKFLPKWFERWSWLSYSKKFDGAFCIPCVLFGHQSGHNGMKLSKLFKEPLVNWQKAVCKFEEHDKNSPFHRASLLRATSFKQIMKSKQEGIDQQLNRMVNERVQCNRQILRSIIETIVLTGTQNIALRGHRDDAQHYDSSNPGNFQALLNYRISGGDDILKTHFETAPKNATYRSKTIQNKLIKICGTQIEQKIKNEVNENQFYSILADEASDCSNKEQMALVIRYIDKQDEINERFIRFIHCDTGLTGNSLANKILTAIKDIGLPLENCRGQGYDGASAMSSMTKGVSGNISKENPKALYVHCASHRLNLCVAKSCKVPFIANCLDNSRSLASFFNHSANRSGFLSEKFSKYGLKKRKLADPSLTRWVARISTLDGLIDGHEAIIEALEEMKLNADKKWNPPTPGEAASFFALFSSFEFIVALAITTGIMDYTMPLTRRLQERRIDVLKSLEQIELLKETVLSLREKADELHNGLYQNALDMAKKVNIVESTPRSCKIQMYRSNHPASTPSEFYKRGITIPFLDHLATEMANRFSTENCKIMNGLYIIPSVFVGCSGVCWKTKFLEFTEAFEDDIPDYRSIASEIQLWEKYWKGNIQTKLPCTVGETLKVIDKIAFRNIFVCLTILGVLPVTSCECERSVSALRRLKTWLRSTMAQERLNGLALMHVNNDIKVNIDDVVTEFARKNKTRMRLKDIFDDNKDENNFVEDNNFECEDGEGSGNNKDDFF